MSNLCILSFIMSLMILINTSTSSIDYGTALSKSLLYYEGQRSGKLPANQRVKWRGDSALNDGKDAGVNLVGGYYDAGDNVKFGLPMAFTITMLVWSTIEFRTQMVAKAEWSKALRAIQWGTDYLINAHPQPDVLYGQVGDGGSDHACWERPEDMTTPRNAYKIDAQHPGADLASESAAALAAAAIAFKRVKPRYSTKLLFHAKQLFDFAVNYPGVYQNSIPSAGDFYFSSGYQDEQLWAAAWLALATGNNTYTNYINLATNTGGTRTMFSWDDKFIGAQVLITKNVLEGSLRGVENLEQFRTPAEQFICNSIQKGSNNVKKSSGGLLWFQDFNNLQYVTSASFIITAYADTLASTKNNIRCPGGVVGAPDLISFARSQVDYILGSNPEGLSYMVGFGQNYPKKVHHRGSSIVSIKKNSTFVSCQDGYTIWYQSNADNPNVIDGAIVGGPNVNDQYTDMRQNFQQTEPATANTAPLVGVLARLAA